jgi:hypothetical protein
MRHVRFEVFTAVTIMMMLFWVLAPCGLVGRRQLFGETYCLHLQDFSPEDGDSMFIRNVGIYFSTILERKVPKPFKMFSSFFPFLC